MYLEFGVGANSYIKLYQTYIDDLVHTSCMFTFYKIYFLSPLDKKFKYLYFLDPLPIFT